MRPLTLVTDAPLSPRDRAVLFGAMTRVGLSPTEARLTSVVPQSSYTTYRAAHNRPAFLHSLGTPVVIVPMGTDALYNLMGLRPSTLYRGLLPPSWAKDIVLGPETHAPTLPASLEWVVPTVAPGSVFGTGSAFLLETDLDRARRALVGQLQIVGGAG